MKISFKEKYNSKFQLEIFIDERIWGVLPKKLLKPFLQSNEIENEEFKEIKELLYNYSRDRLFTYLTQQEHSELESRNYLKKLKLHKSILENIIDFCLDKKFISDARLAELYVRSMIDLGKSKTEISYKLKTKGISASLIEQELTEQYNDQAKEEILKDNIAKAVKVYTNRGCKDVYNKCCTFLIGKGFFYSDFSELLKQRLNYNEEDD